MSFQQCLAALAKKEASSEVIQLVATFLSEQTMTEGKIMSTPKPVTGGCPQGSILGVFLFNTTIDDLEDGCDDIEDYSVDVDVEDGAQDRSETAGPFPSTPARRGVHEAEPIAESPIVRRRAARTRLDFSFEMRQEIPYEPNYRTESKWIAKLAALLRFVDDGFTLSKVNFENSVGFTVNGQPYRVKHAIQSQNVFRHIVRRAENIGMVVNSQKTTLVCVSDSLSYKSEAFILDSDGKRIDCQDGFKALGVHFLSTPTLQAHINSICKKFRSRYWTLRNLKLNGFTCEELVQVYKTMILPVTDYACVMYHSSLTETQDLQLERLQNHALKTIFGTGISARKARELASLSTLRARREILCENFAKKCLKNPLFAAWFPLKTARTSTRNRNAGQEIYLETKARCDRLKNSPLHYFRRILNGKPGKIYND